MKAQSTNAPFSLLPKTPPCHIGPIEIHPGLWLGSQEEGEEALIKGKAKIAVPLNKMDGHIWKEWDGEIIYIPITDYSVLPREIAIRKVRELIEKLKTSSLAMFCLGGHGRTGYMAALMLGFMGYSDPIAFLREHYCKKAVESTSQIYQIAEILNRPELKKHKAIQIRGQFDYQDYWCPQFDYQDYWCPQPEEKNEEVTCGSCNYSSICKMEDDFPACKLYSPRKGGE